MAWKIIFSYTDGGIIRIVNNKKKLTKEMAEHYQKMYARPSNDGGVVYVSPYKSCNPVSLQEYITEI